MQWAEPSEKVEKKERSSRSKDKVARDKDRDKDKDKDKKERKVGRKRDRLADDGSSLENTKIRKEDDKGSFKSSSHQNGGSDLLEPSHREKRHYPRGQVSPTYQSERESDKSRERVARTSHSTDRARSLEVNDRVSERDRENRDSRDNRDNYRRTDTSKRR